MAKGQEPAQQAPWVPVPVPVQGRALAGVRTWRPVKAQGPACSQGARALEPRSHPQQAPGSAPSAHQRGPAPGRPAARAPGQQALARRTTGRGRPTAHPRAPSPTAGQRSEAIEGQASDGSQRSPPCPPHQSGRAVRARRRADVQRRPCAGRRGCRTCGASSLCSDGFAVIASFDSLRKSCFVRFASCFALRAFRLGPSGLTHHLGGQPRRP